MTKWVKFLIITNVAVFALTEFIMPGLGNWLAFTPALVMEYPWLGYTIITYMFVHGGPMHILFNMLTLFFFGPRVESRMGSKHFLQMYFAAGIAGAALSLLLAPKVGIVGASGSIYGVMLCFAAFWPRAQILLFGVIPVEAWLLVVLTTLYSMFSGITGSRDGIAHYAHLGGYVGAYLYLLFIERNSPARKFRAKVGKVAPETDRAVKQNWKNVNLENVHAISREEVNRILDKISAQGVGALTEQEKLFLSNFVPPDDRKAWTQ